MPRVGAATDGVEELSSELEMTIEWNDGSQDILVEVSMSGASKRTVELE